MTLLVRLLMCLCAQSLGVPAVAAAAAAQQPGAELLAKSSDAAAIVQRAAQGPVRIIVSYSLPDVAASGSSGDVGRIEDQNRKLQDAIIADHFGPAAATAPERALRRMAITPAFAINASLPEIEDLARDNRVLHIGLDAVRGFHAR
jgi:hypothetical protein